MFLGLVSAQIHDAQPSDYSRVYGQSSGFDRESFWLQGTTVQERLFAQNMVNEETNTILFTLVYRDEEFRVQTSRNKYHSLMSLISAYLPIIGFGLCSGMGSCGTCVVEIDGMRRLSCDLAVNEELANTRIVLRESFL